tara:strand:+ start:731 stop:967 length:237 start_codon:yes stop_codon:yes gene_type:complete
MGRMKDNVLENEMQKADLVLNHTKFEMYLLSKRKKDLEKISMNLLNAFDRHKGVSKYNEKMIAKYKKDLIKYFKQDEL